jgi:nitronate monooxygenase
MECDLPPLRRPRFLPIIASNALAATLLKKSNGKVDGFIIEGPTAGGHNAPPRGKVTLNAQGEPVYGERDRVSLEAIRGLGVPFWLAGGFGGPDVLQAALDEGAAGVQVGTAFAYCENRSFGTIQAGGAPPGGAGEFLVRTDWFFAVGFPFKVVQLEGTASDERCASTAARLRPRLSAGSLPHPDGRITFGAL